MRLMDGNDSDSSENEDMEEYHPPGGGDGGGGDGGGGGGGGGGGDDDDGEDSTDDNNDNESDEECPFDITLAATHSYMGAGLVAVGGRSVLEPGWRGKVPVVAHHGCVFPGETVPMLLPHASDAAILSQSIKSDKLFGLLCPDETGTLLSGYGVLCEVFEAGLSEDEEMPTSITFKARATQRFRMLHVPKLSVPVHAFTRLRVAEVAVLAEGGARDPLRARLASLDPLRTPNTQEAGAVQRRLRAMDAAVTPWPRFVYDMFDYHRMRHTVRDFFSALSLELPEDPVSLSFWVASNLALSARDRLALFAVDNALLRLHMECKLIDKKTVLCCSSCMTEIARRENIFAMSSEGVHSNYTNPGGYMHDVVTVSRACNTAAHGAPSAEYSWFPGYAWSVALCATCMAHVGWRFAASRRSLRPHSFYALCRNYVSAREPPDASPPH